MRQISLNLPGEFVERHVPVPQANPGEALICVERVGICGSDFHAFDGSHPAYTYPRVLGHEVSCVVVEAPPNRFGIKAGDRCALEPYLSCGDCHACRMERPNCCENLKLYGVHMDGGMQGFLSAPLHLLHKSEKLSLDQLALVETLGIGAHAVTRSGLQPAEEVLVVGAGPIGIGVIQFAHAAGASVSVVEKSERRRKFVERLGFPCYAEAGERVAHAVFDATGSPRAMSASLSHVAAGGKLIFVGLTSSPVSLDDALFHRREVTIYASRNSCNQFPRIIKLIEDGKIDTSPWITDRLTLSSVVGEFKLLLRRKSLIKAIVDLEESDR